VDCDKVLLKSNKGIEQMIDDSEQMIGWFNFIYHLLTIS